jgi:hypothetical protein
MSDDKKKTASYCFCGRVHPIKQLCEERLALIS